jgi:hypothetical protein
VRHDVLSGSDLGVRFESSPESTEIIEIDKRKDASLILTLCSELRRQHMRIRDACGGGDEGGLGTDKSKADWIKRCCCGLSSLCYFGESSSSMEGDEYRYAF